MSLDFTDNEGTITFNVTYDDEDNVTTFVMQYHKVYSDDLGISVLTLQGRPHEAAKSFHQFEDIMVAEMMMIVDPEDAPKIDPAIDGVLRRLLAVH